MKLKNEENRYVYKTQGVCPPEIHFRIREDFLEDVRFVGGGCPGNAQLVSRLVAGQPIDSVLAQLDGITCRNDTSCPDQLSKAIAAARCGNLAPAASFEVFTDSQPRHSIALIGELEGRSHVLSTLIPEMRESGVEAICCVGNLTGTSGNNTDILRHSKKERLLAVQGKQDRQYAFGEESRDLPSLYQKERDYLLRLPQVLSFQIGEKQAMAFFGEYIMQLHGFSDFEPFALEMNMVCNLSCFLQDETVFPALEAMTPQFGAQVVIFSQPQRWGHWELGGVNFISLGKSCEADKLAWGLLQGHGEKIDFQVRRIPLP